MLKIISKINCQRCEEVKNYLTVRGIEFEVEMAEDKGYAFWRDLIQNTTGKLGFPILLKYVTYEDGSDDWKYINGSFEEIINEIDKLYPQETIASVTEAKQSEMPKYFWGE